MKSGIVASFLGVVGCGVVMVGAAHCGGSSGSEIGGGGDGGTDSHSASSSSGGGSGSGSGGNPDGGGPGFEAGTCMTGLTKLAPAGMTISMRVNSEAVYWTNYVGDAGSVLAVPLCGGPVVTISAPPESGEPQDIVLTSDKVYWTDSTSSTPGVRYAPLHGGPTSLVEVGQPGAWGIANDATNVYWTSTGAGATEGQVLQYPLAGGVITTLVTTPDEVRGITVDAHNVYYADPSGTGSLWSVPIGGGSPMALATNVGQPYDPRISGDNLYFIELKMGLIGSVPLTGGAISTIVGGDKPGAISFSSTDIYWSDQIDNDVLKMPIGGGTIVTIDIGTQTPKHVIVDSTSVYWINDGFSVVRQTPN